MKALIGLGANLGEREDALKFALDSLSGLCGTKLLAASSLYETAPVETLEEQPDYANCVALLETDLSPRALLGACLGIEAAAGRKRVKYHGARCLDLDLLLYEGFESADSELTLPHPRMGERAFVLVPMSELFPDGIALGYDFAENLKAVSGQRVSRKGRIV